MSCCENKISELEDELKNLIVKSKSTKQEYLNLLNVNLQKDLEIRKLKRNIEQNKFASFETELSKDCLFELRSIGNSQKEDSQFVSVALSTLYKNDVQIIRAKCLSNRSKNPEQSAISPEKRKILDRIFTERLSYISMVEEERKNNLSKLIRNAIDNAIRKR